MASLLRVYNLLGCNCNEPPNKVSASWNKKMYRERLVLGVRLKVKRNNHDGFK